MQAEGRWDEQEHEKFLQGISRSIAALMAFGKNWKMIEEVVQTRTTAQVRSHAQKFFLKLHKI
jgi:SHAQKYF class myb-like DNA-binding protein